MERLGFQFRVCVRSGAPHMSERSAAWPRVHPRLTTALCNISMLILGAGLAVQLTALLLARALPQDASTVRHWSAWIEAGGALVLALALVFGRGGFTRTYIPIGMALAVTTFAALIVSSRSPFLLAATGVGIIALLVIGWSDFGRFLRLRK